MDSRESFKERGGIIINCMPGELGISTVSVVMPWVAW
jgi:hypothetical protein